MFIRQELQNSWDEARERREAHKLHAMSSSDYGTAIAGCLNAAAGALCFLTVSAGIIEPSADRNDCLAAFKTTDETSLAQSLKETGRQHGVTFDPC